MIPPKLLSPEIKMLALAVAMIGSYALGRYEGVSLEAASHLREESVANKAITAAQEGAAKEIAKLEIKHVTLQQRIERETREVPVYRDCKHSAGGLQQLNAALENRAVPADGSQLPGNAGPGTRR